MSPLARAIVSRKKVDERTMEFTFDRPRWDMTGFFAGLNITRAETFPKLLTGENVQGTGPYAFKSWTPGVGFTLVRNDNWHLSAQEGGPYLDEIRATVFANETAAATAFEAGELDVVFRLPGADAKRFGDRVRKAQRIGGLFIGMVVKNPVLADRRVRQALFLAVDKERIAKEVGEGFYPATSQIWPAYSPGYDPALDVPNYDPERAKALLKEAGFSQGQPLQLEFTQRSTASVTIAQQNFEAIGVKVNLVPNDTNAFINRARQRQFTDLFASGMNFSDPVPASALLGNGNVAIPNTCYQESPELADILKRIGTVDPLGPEAKELYARFNRLWLEDPWIIPLEPSGALDVASPKVQGFDEYFIVPLQAPNFGRIWLKA
jgi:peptide/nickel transport system substrate-binding protein